MAKFEILRKVPTGIEIWQDNKGREEQIGFAGADVLLAAILNRVPTQQEEEILRKTGELKVEVK